jgi:hypothetical protein
MISNELKNSFITYQFNCKNNTQKIIIDILINYTNYDIQKLAEYMETSTSELLKVKHGESYLEKDQRNLLSRLFLVSFG